MKNTTVMTRAAGREGLALNRVDYRCVVPRAPVRRIHGPPLIWHVNRSTDWRRNSSVWSVFGQSAAEPDQQLVTWM